MEKIIYLVRGTTAEDHNTFSQRILATVKKASEDPVVQGLKVTLTVVVPPRVSVIPFKKARMAAVSAYIKSGHSVEVLDRLSGIAGKYLVDEALPVKYEKTWNDGDPTPGVCLLTLFNQKKSIDYETFINRWHNGHTPLSLRLHPLWNYSRNVVKDRVSGDGEKFDGIVEEQFRTTSELMNPFKFFGNALTAPYHMLEVYLDTISFIDYGSMETYLAKEYVIKSLDT